METKTKVEFLSNDDQLPWVYVPTFISTPELYFIKLMEEIEFERKTIFCYGKYHFEPRATAIFGKENVLDKVYIYSRSERKLSLMTKTLYSLCDIVEKYTEQTFDFVLVNLYESGKDKVDWHSDDEKMMDHSHIVSLSFGEERQFKFRTTSLPHKIVWKEFLKSGSLVWMKPGCQDNYQHTVTKTEKKVGPRINLTFRKFK